MRLNRFYFDQNISVDNALSSNQIIHQLIKQLNEVVEAINNFESDSHQYTDTKVAALRTEMLAKLNEEKQFLLGQIADLRAHVDDVDARNLAEAKGYTDSSIDSFKTDYVDVKIAEIYARINSVKSYLENEIHLVDTRLQNVIEDVRNELLALLKGGGAIYSIYDGELKSVQETMYDISKEINKFDGLSWGIFEKYFNKLGPQFARRNSGYITKIPTNNYGDGSRCQNGGGTSAPVLYRNGDYFLDIANWGELSAGPTNTEITVVENYGGDATKTQIIIWTTKGNFDSATKVRVYNTPTAGSNTYTEYDCTVTNSGGTRSVEFVIDSVNCHYTRMEIWSSSKIKDMTLFYVGNRELEYPLTLTWELFEKLQSYFAWAGYRQLTYDFVERHFFSGFVDNNFPLERYHRSTTEHPNPSDAIAMAWPYWSYFSEPGVSYDKIRGGLPQITKGLCDTGLTPNSGI